MAAGPRMNDDGKAKKQHRCTLADRQASTVIGMPWNTVTTGSNWEKGDPRMDMKLLPNDVPKTGKRLPASFDPKRWHHSPG
eukprot:6750703-Pyramimonas_sp.AAC.1